MVRTKAQFDDLGKQAWQMGFKLVHSGPLVRSSHHAGELAGQMA